MSKNKKRRKEWLYLSTAKAIEQHLITAQLTQVPSLHELTKLFDVGESTIEKAMQELARRKVIQCRRGRRAQVVVHKSGPQDQATHISENGKLLFSMLLQEIQDGKRKIGTPLPKIDYLVVKLRISRRSVAQVFQKLSLENHIHKEGKKWIVGPKNTTSNVFTGSKSIINNNAPVVLVFSSTYSVWIELLKSYRHNTFATTLYEELDKQNIRMISCCSTLMENNSVLHAGLENVSRLISSLKDRYLGTILAGGTLLGQLKSQPSQWLDMFAATGKPLVWCNLVDIKTDIPARELPANLKFIPILHNDASAVAMALDALASQGHVRIGVPYLAGTPKQPHWSQVRMSKITDTASKQYPRMRIVTAEMTGELWREGPQQAVPDVIYPHIFEEKLKNHIQQFPESNTQFLPIRQKYISAAAFLTRLLEKENVTAIIAPNDYFASQYYVWLSLLDVSIPRDISIVSFDNSMYFRAYPITSIDRNYSQMAFYAVHTLIGDTPALVDNRGVIQTKTFLVDRGSLAAPRQKKLKL